MVRVRINFCLLAFVICSAGLFGSEDGNLSQGDSSLPISDSDLPITKKREWTVIVDFAAQNNLCSFADKNLLEMTRVGSSKKLNLLAQFDRQGKDKVLRVLVEKDELIVKEEFESTKENSSGSAKNLLELITWGVKNYPAEHYAVILWNHGMGTFNPEFSDSEATVESRGISINDKYDTYIKDTELKEVLEKVSKESLSGEKIDIVGFDACIMGTVEIATQIQNAAKIMVASSEIIHANGWCYDKILEPLAKKTMTPEKFSKHIVSCYQRSYKKSSFQGYTLAATNLEKIKVLNKSLSTAALILIKLLSDPKDNQLREVIKFAAKNRRLVPGYFNREFLDTYCFCGEILKKLPMDSIDKKNYRSVMALQSALEKCKEGIKDAVIHNESGPTNRRAQGLSIYFPPSEIHLPYLHNDFSKSTFWSLFLKKMLSP
ncbi:hypothetical protein HOD08_03435 [bacterium]|nr:hypothetical protein [bacterium]